MAGPSIIVVGASAGGVEALSTLVRGLPEDLRAAVFVVLHVSAGGRDLLPDILSRRGALEARRARDGAAIEQGVIYVAPSDQHLLIEQDHVRLSRGPKVNRTRPAVDPLFRSAAQSHGSRVIGVVLSGTLDDGAAGIRAVKDAGGTTIVQDPEEALFPDMPRNAIETGAVDHVLSVSEIPSLVTRLAGGEPEEAEMGQRIPAEPAPEQETIHRDFVAQEQGERTGQPSVLTCPDCGGVVWEFGDQVPLRYRCHVGHEYSWQTMLSGHSDGTEEALWRAVRLLDEHAALNRRMANQFRAMGVRQSADQLDVEAQVADRQADTIRQLIAEKAVADRAALGTLNSVEQPASDAASDPVQDTPR